MLADVLVTTSSAGDLPDPIESVRAIAVALFEAVADRPWLGAYFMRDTGVQQNGLALFERLGQQMLRLDLTPRQRFHAVSTVIGFVVGVAADMGQQPPREVLAGEVTREEHLARFVAEWRALDAEAFPFIHHVADEFEDHDDAEQFRAGLDLILTGLRDQAGQG
ncbi:hypothetical protein GCM10025868_28870 [Angustibacter aerolatus]|uniref:Tetracycline repressor TetR C-terminal domain-containing protein n=1 Tax=Angustibacter aerolatus TaxID=1162965 RepID=A0ABQ6JIR4_9ACTN|nr:TetR/AcrR family transcriptional regulator C-terminal domain-containing protein [Angustibacter aerolatus]GMA87637.1 hypothetical protein GCM10025868_28870 [Angustibacter aerolatus]